MQLEVSLAGFSSSWLYRGSRNFTAWAEAKPWLLEGGVCVIRAEPGHANGLVFSSVTRFLHGINSGERPLDVKNIECGGTKGSPIEALLCEFELGSDISPFQARDRIANRLLDRSLVLVFTERAAVDPNDWEHLVNLLEHFRKASKPVRLCAIIIDVRGVVHSEPVCDYASGRPSHTVFSDASSISATRALWSSYLHHRVAWEAGGSLSYALSLSREVEKCVPGDDDELERHLQAHAEAALLAHRGRENLFGWTGVGSGGTRVDAARRQSTTTGLFAMGLLWRPPAMNGFHVVPWASRVLLRLPDLPKTQVWTLRHQLVCAPLAAEILSLCLKFESQIQTRLHGRQKPDHISQKMIDSHTRFKDGNDAYVVYPDAFPLRPEREEDVWAFASLGEVLKSCPPGAVSDPYWWTLQLRNAIAHGHYVGWSHVESALRMRNIFDT
ncbi:hypothetical protein ACFQ3P_42455 [Paraburkholderia sabiae]|uniref:ApeA N-terminal domain-containing protein n=1 Tax=Paraburkholderia sabiae TaxID=273251 RepID=A0ABU9QTH6_9BURK|nr:hypothetical protein [Paraburkholderia sabiae]WJZ79903.1 hypothetical protein QEN71_42815 [Paraburkholderia sabiae]CAD6563208.1 hypothetical protein LMG24235_08450 [Paraburkholderia sabiae]